MNSLDEDEIDLKRIVIDEEERKTFDKGKGFNPRIRRKEELLSEAQFSELKSGML